MLLLRRLSIFLYARGFSVYAIGTPKPMTRVPALPATPTPDIADPTVTGVADRLIADDHIVYLNGYDDGDFRPEDKISRAADQ